MVPVGVEAMQTQFAASALCVDFCQWQGLHCCYLSGPCQVVGGSDAVMGSPSKRIGPG
ncbi:hypothetical protein RKD18_005641 [Streptomyces phaeoluteigriseus]